MNIKPTDDRILIIDQECRVVGISEACRKLLELDTKPITAINFLDLNFGLSLYQLRIYLEKMEKDQSFSFKTFLSSHDQGIVNLTVAGIHVPDMAIFVLHINPEEQIDDANQFGDPRRFYQTGQDKDKNYRLEDLMDAPLLQEIMDYFYDVTGIPIGIIDLDGRIIVQEGWQDICTKFHRCHPETLRNCLESDCQLTSGIRINQYRQYKCKNNLWDIATPIYINDQRMGHIFLGQFFYDDEPIDYDFFRNQAHRFGFDEEAYLQALDTVPRFSRHLVDMSMRFYSKIAVYISQLSFTNIKINETLDELYNVLNFQTELMDTIPTPIFYKNTDRVYLGGNKAFDDFLGLSPSDYVGKTTADIAADEYATVYDQSDLELLEKQGQQVYEYQVKTRSGAPKDVIFNKALFRNLSGEAAGIIGVIQDITALKTAQKQLLQVNSEIIETQKEVIYTLGQIIESRSQEAAKHVIRVAEYAYLMGLEFGLGDDEATLLKIATPMHDVGKIGIPDHILNKPGALTRDEFEIIKTHTTIGYDILKNSQYKILKLAATIALSHHERWDGSGYPAGLAGTAINPVCRIVSIADVFDAISHQRCYKEAWPLDQVRAFLTEQRGAMFDPVLIDIFFANWERILEIREDLSDHD
ncbi:PocR ligand-binding domain-containing protein [Acetobacterium sp.]|uniref:PocR ligand-binding domain-containing protein n=1 Tax=Acetobacterium sp. TaxID=1872094 RepID=UPI00271FA9C2|nr:PocR ligand-binding domain-containing protein [Acetobacterium sp.]MDO9490968.1 PocR ligand-binding domain-containing protein [Acetobacterium sp.]